MASRREEKERVRRERLARERAQLERARRNRFYGFATAGGLILVAIVVIVVVVASGGGSSDSGASASSGSLSSANFGGLADRRKAAGVPTMAEASVVGAAHFHPHLEVYVNGNRVKIPPNIGIDPGAAPTDMAGLHTHDNSGTIHNEAGTGSRLGQFFAVWGVALSNKRLGPYRATKKKQVKMWIDGKRSREFANLRLKDGQQIVVAYGTEADEPF